MLPLLLASAVFIPVAAGEACLYLNNINLVGGTYDEFNSTDIKSCCIACANEGCCIGYTFSRELRRCYLKSAINHSEDSSLFYSGVKANHAGMAARLKNVKIEGPNKNSMFFDVQEDCKQYCTAFGMYSWSPSRNGVHGGECFCLNRIVRMSYDHGSVSYISAPQKPTF